MRTYRPFYSSPAAVLVLTLFLPLAGPGSAPAPAARSADLFYDGFESGALGSPWRVETTNDGRVQVGSAYPYLGSYSLLLDDAVDDSTKSIAAAVLTLDLGGQSEVELDFWWREFGDEDDAEDGVFLSDDDGATWHEVWSFNGSYGVSWQHTVLDLDAEAALNGLALHDHVQVKFQFADNSAIDTDGYAIDEVAVRAYPPPTPATLPFYDGFESGALGASWVAEVTREGRVRVGNTYPYAGSYSLLLDDGGDHARSLAMAILALDLSGQAQVELDFWWREFGDEDDAEDGVFLSDDEGATWHQVLSFNGDHGSTWQQAAIDLDAAAGAAGLALNDRFQVKFQFYDDLEVPSDGYGLDEVRVRAITPAAFPYYDSFELGSLGDAWSLFTTGEGRVRVGPSYPYSGTYSLLLDCSGATGKVYAAAILNVDLGGQAQVMLDLSWREFSDEDDPGDGVFLSDDGGATWHPALSFNGDHGSTWQKASLDLAALAAGSGLSLNDGFQIKFQFYDDSSIDSDGYAVDDVRVRANAAPALAWPGATGYEADGLEPENGHTRMTYVYRIEYADADADPPAGVAVHIQKGGAEVAGSPFAMDCPAGDYAGGVVCSHDQVGLDAGSDYTYFFTAQDGQGNAAAPTTAIDAPDVSIRSWIYQPVVLRNVGPPAGPPVLAPIDNPGGSYRYTVRWSEVERATRYLLQEDNDPAFPSPATAYSGPGTSADVRAAGLGPYYYRVRASNDQGISAWSNVQSTRVTVSPPPCPTVGPWEGLTEYGRIIRFTVSDTPQCQVENLRISYVICASAVTTSFYGTFPIVNNHFETGGSQSSVTGDFTSSTTAAGAYHFEMMCPSDPPIPDIVSGDWTASYQP